MGARCRIQLLQEGLELLYGYALRGSPADAVLHRIPSCDAHESHASCLHLHSVETRNHERPNRLTNEVFALPHTHHDILVILKLLDSLIKVTEQRFVCQGEHMLSRKRMPQHCGQIDAFKCI